ncbi:hypothetical protein WJX81_005218 [Elliptochloris bilobata]|uniref:Uncharacterized protein n=1 Tax=Elliptochloris bilobata TaxID=381761 RepID=A0AAW1S4E5_9CHLO
MLSQWGRVEDEATESMTPRKPAALNTQGGLLTRPSSGTRMHLLLICGLCFAQLLVLAVLGGGLTVTRLMVERVDVALEGLDLTLLQAVPLAPVDWVATLAGHRLVSQEEEVDGLHSDSISFSGGMFNRTTTVTSGSALVSNVAATGPYSVGSGILSLNAVAGNSSDVGLAPVQRILAAQGAWVRLTNAATGESELFALLAGGG